MYVIVNTFLSHFCSNVLTMVCVLAFLLFLCLSFAFSLLLSLNCRGLKYLF